MLSNDEMIGLQAEKHDLVISSGFRSEHEYVLHLMHTKAYEHAVRLAAGRRVLDLGCNTGYGTAILARSAERAIGVDVSPKAVEAARQARRGANLEFRLIDGSGLPFPDGAFGLVVACQVIEHIVDHGAFLGEVRRVLAPGGAAVFTTPNGRLRLDPGMKPWNPFHVREYDAREVAALLSGSFPHVDVFGLFAEEPISSIERSRMSRSREIARRSAPGRVMARFEASAVLLASRLRRLFARASRTGVRTGPLDVFIREHGIDDLEYRGENLLDALDLLAVCTDPEDAQARTRALLR